MTEEEARQKEEARQRKLANLKVFKPYSECTEEEREEQAKIVEKAKEGTRKYHEHQRTLKEQTKVILNTRLSREQLQKIVGESCDLILDDDMTVQTALILSALKEATTNGNVKAMEFLRDTSGQKPKDEISLDASLITTEQDRSLLEKVEKRLSVG